MSELKAVLEARRRRTDALANLISDDDDLDLSGLPTNPGDINTILQSNDDEEVSMPPTPPSLKSRNNKNTPNKNLMSPSSLSNEQTYRPFVERSKKLKTTAAASSTTAAGTGSNNNSGSSPAQKSSAESTSNVVTRKLSPNRFTNYNNNQQQQPAVRTYSNPPSKLSSDEPSDEETDNNDNNNDDGGDNGNNTAISPRQRYLQQRNFFPSSSSGAAGGGSATGSETNSELQLRLRDRWNKVAHGESSGGGVDPPSGEGGDGKQRRGLEPEESTKVDPPHTSSTSATMRRELTPPSAVVSGRNAYMAAALGKKSQSSSPPPPVALAPGGAGRGGSPTTTTSTSGNAVVAGSGGGRPGFFMRTTPTIRQQSNHSNNTNTTTTSRSISNSSSLGSVNSYGSNNAFVGGATSGGSSSSSGRFGGGGRSGLNHRGDNNTSPIPMNNDKVMGEIDWPSEDDDEKNAPPQQQEPSQQQQPPASPSKIGGRNTNQSSFARTVAGRSSRTGYISGTGSGKSDTGGSGTGGSDYYGSSNPQMLSFMAKKYKESKNSPRSGGTKGGGGGGSEVATTGGGVESGVVVTGGNKDEEKEEAPPSPIPEYMGFKLRKTNRGGGGGGGEESTASDSGGSSPQVVSKQLKSSSSDPTTDNNANAAPKSNNVQRRWQPQQQQSAPQSKESFRGSGGNVASRYQPNATSSNNGSNNNTPNNNNSVGRIANSRFHVAAAAAIAKEQESPSGAGTAVAAQEESLNGEEIKDDFDNLVANRSKQPKERNEKSEEQPPRQQQGGGKYIFNNYDTAVMAAKNAITASNLNRMKSPLAEEVSPLDPPISPTSDDDDDDAIPASPLKQQPWHKKNEDQRLEETYGESILDDKDEDGDNNDPDLGMEGSPSDDMFANKLGYPFLDSLVLRQEGSPVGGGSGDPLDMVYSADQSEERHYMSPTSTNEEETPKNRQAVDSFFGTSFLGPSDNEEIENDIPPDDLFGGDPFDPFNTGVFSYQSPSKDDDDDDQPQHRNAAVASSGKSVDEQPPPQTPPIFEAKFDHTIPASNKGDEYIEEEVRPKMSSESMMGLSRVSISRSGTETSYEISPRASNDTMGEFKADAGDLMEDFSNSYEAAAVDEKPVQKTVLFEDIQQHSQPVGDHDVPGSFIMQPLPFPSDMAGKHLPEPKSNPLSGNLIVCKPNGRGDFVIQEVDISGKKPVAILTANLLTNELKTRLARSSAVSKNTKIVGVSSVLSLAAGVHRVQGRARVRVAALVEVLVVGNSRNGAMEKIRLVAVWKWGYNPGGISLASLQSVLSTKTIDGGSNEYNPNTLQVADGLLFLGGREISSYPVVFVAKPAVRDSWTSVPITNSTAEIVSALATTNDTNPYIAIGFDDGRVSIWSYDLAVRTNRITVEQATSMLRLLNHIRGELDVSDLSDADCLWPHERFFSVVHRGSSDSKRQNYESAHVKEPQCTSLSWIKPSSSAISSLPLLAASFSSGIAVYLVPSADQTASTVDIISPLAQAKFLSFQEKSEIEATEATTLTTFHRPKATLTWYDLGPRSPPCVAMTFEHETVAVLNDSITIVDRSPVHRLCLCAIDIPWYGSTEISDPGTRQNHRAIGVLCQNDVNLTDPAILDSPTTGSIVCYTGGNFLTCQPTLASSTSSRIKADGFFASLSCPVSSSSLGLDSTGSVYFGDENTVVKSDYRDTVLSIFPLISCNGEMGVGMSGTTIPSQRYWMLISNSGDSEMDALPRERSKKHSTDGDDEIVQAGAVADVLCELTCGENPVSGLVPGRVVKEQGGRRVAVLYSTGFFGGNTGFGDEESERSRTHTRIPPSPVAYAIIDLDEAMKHRGSTPFTLRHGRDVAFLPPTRTGDGFYCSSLVVLDPSGSYLSMTTAISSSTLSEGDNEVIVESIGKCSLQYEGIEGRRVFVLLNGNNPEVLVSGYSELVGLPCLVVCKHSLERESNQLTLVEGTDQGRRLWLKPGEDVITLVELPVQKQGSRSNIALATQQRVMILSVSGDSISIIAEVDAFLTCTNLSPIGSHCVAFSASASSCGGGTTRVMYLSCLQNVGGHGIISTLPSPRYGKSNSLLAAIRPDRIVYSDSHGGIRHANEGEDDSSFIVPLPQTRPAFLLEPLIANALCQDELQGMQAATSSDVQSLLRTVIEKFGRKESTFPYSDNEGIGLLGAGVTKKVYDLLVNYNCKDAVSLLLTGNLPEDLSSRPTILPPWIPMSTKLSATRGADTALQVLSSGDNNLAEYLRNPDRVAQTALPKPNDPSSIAAKELAMSALSSGKRADAAKLLDFAGQQSTEGVLLELAMRSTNADPMLQRLIAKSDSSATAIKNYAEILHAFGLKPNDSMSMAQLAPSVQSTKSGRSRTGAIDASVIDACFPSKSSDENIDPAWKDAMIESRHVWSAGPFGKKEELLQLDSFDDWFGRCRPTVLGEEGVAMAADTGERALANILRAAAKDGVDEAEDDSEDATVDTKRRNWIDGVGEGRLDEDNLSLYMRFSEGADEDCNWRADGFSDLTKQKYHARLYGSELASLEATTSSVDEGEEGKVHLLYDVVYNDGAPRESATGIAVEVSRGGYLDVGMLHSSEEKARQRCTVEMWYHLPQAHLVTDEIILMRRSLFYEENDDASNLCLPDERHNTLWELAVLPTGLLELRTGAGSVVTSAMFIKDNDDGLDGIVSWERESGGGGWNHVCVTFSSMEQDSPSKVSASVLMNGVTVVPDALLSVDPFGSVSEDVNQDDIDDALEKSILIFGIGPSVGFRMTDIRVWACKRSEEDVQTMMYEYLKEAEMRRKFKVNIRKSSAGLLSPPPARFPQPEQKKFALAPPKPSQTNRTPPRSTSADDGFGFGGDEAKFDAAFAVNKAEPVLDQTNETDNLEEAVAFPPSIETPVEIVLSDLLSTTVKKSAAAAIIRGPPAARHFGGNRGGLTSTHTNFGLKPDGVGPIAITGPDKSLVFFSDRDPPGRTYPIGASGAVLSDIMDENYSEYMCCFLAREKRMIIFELTRKTVVVELQMKTKLNFWRYLPPEAHGGELAFILITPIGGFHWKPLENPPRPRQVWKRSLELESKKVITYEEGGSNGQLGTDARSTVALLLVSSPVSSDANVEAYCISMDGDSTQLLISEDIQGAALCRLAPKEASSRFLPFVATVQNNESSQLVLTVEDLTDDGSLRRGATVASTILDLVGVPDESYDPPPMSMGLSPEVLVCCCDDFIVVVIRRKGLILAYDFTGDLSLVVKHELERYVVDAAIRPNGDDRVELVCLLRESNDSKDGRIATIHIAREDNEC